MDGNLIPAVVVAAIVSGVIGYLIATLNRDTALTVRDRETVAEAKILAAKIDADYRLALAKVEADAAARLGERAWSDYELRRDAYIALARQIGVLFADADPTEKPEFHRTARHVRLVGSDEVVTALNHLTAAIKDSAPDTDLLYRALFNAMRRDIRQIHSLPPEGTDLNEDAFPLES